MKLRTALAMIFMLAQLTYGLSVQAEEPKIDPKVLSCTKASNYAWPDFLLDKTEARQLFNEEDCVIKSPTGKLLTEEELKKLRDISFAKCMAFPDMGKVEQALSYAKKQFYCVSHAIDIHRENCKQIVRNTLPDDFTKKAQLVSSDGSCTLNSPKSTPMSPEELKKAKADKFESCLAEKDETKIADELAQSIQTYYCVTNGKTEKLVF